MLWVLVCAALFASAGLTRADTFLRGNSTHNGLPHLVPLTKRNLTRPENWAQYAEKGRSLYKTWEEKPEVNEPISWSIPNQCCVAVQPTKLEFMGAMTEEILLKSKIVSRNDDTGYEKINATCPKRKMPEGKRRARFRAATSAKHGIFVAEDNEREDLSRDKHFSQIAWWFWQTAVDRSDPDSCDIDYSGLKYFFRDNILTPKTEQILDYITDGQREMTLTYRPHDPSIFNNPFWALLGTPHGSGIIYMLIEHKGDMKGNGITSLNVEKLTISSPKPRVPEETAYTIWATIEPTYAKHPKAPPHLPEVKVEPDHLELAFKQNDD